MVNFGPDFKNKEALSSSKIDKYKHCSQSYYANYILKCPNVSNSGSSKGDVIHNILELLSISRRKPLVAKIRAADSCRLFPALWKLIKRYADKNDVGIESELDIIDKYLLVALNNEFHGPEGTIEVIIEKAFDFEVIEDGKNYRCRGFIDKSLIILKPDGTMELQMVDYKSSKAKFDAKKILSSGQAIIYSLAAKYLWPQYKLTKFTFLFLKFPKSPEQEFKLLSDSALDGYEYELTQIQHNINNFAERNIGDNLGVTKWETKGLCGPAKSGWICPHQKPFYYYVLMGKDNNFIKSAFTKAELVAKEGEKIERKWFAGCIFFHDQDTGAPRRLNMNGE